MEPSVQIVDGVEELGHRRPDGIGFEQKAVVSGLGGNLAVGHPAAGRARQKTELPIRWRPMAYNDEHGLEVVPLTKCVRYLESTEVARLAFMARGRG